MAELDKELWALCYLHDWDPPNEGQEHRWEPGKNIFPEVHALYTSHRDAEAIRKDMIDPAKYWVVRARPENEARLNKVRASTTSAGVMAIATERRRQIETEGWTPEHDDKHAHGEMAAAAACYAVACLPKLDIAAWCWPWDASWWKPTNRRRNLVKAGALIAAEIDRLDRASKPEASE